ncbi:MAG: hypothetical protein HY201_03460 [Nitrospirae bacterium]|nr:hypothetical protein [Candidatus Troglogloeales bacterium]MBI3598495.1 hypothetical protein [Candidatus Troglogloeales bacterium]
MTRKKGQRALREGRGLFIALLVVSGICIVVLGVLFFSGRAITLFTFKKFVVNKAFVRLLPREYTLEKAELIRKQVYDFYDHAEEEGIPDTTVMRVSQKIQQIMADEKMTDEEVQSLLTLIEKGKGTG